jgi:hypothetical protein
MERNEKLRVFFQNGSTIIDTTPESEVEIVVDYYNPYSRPIDVFATFDSPNLINLHKETLKLDNIPPRKNLMESIRFTTPTKFNQINIEVTVEEKAGVLFQQTRGEPQTVTLTIRLQRQKTIETVRSPAIDRHLEEIAEIGEPIIVSLDSEGMVDIIPIVGDLRSNPSIAFVMPTTAGIPIQWTLDEKSINSLIQNAQEALDVLEKVSEDQNTLRFFIDQFRNYFINQGASVETVGDTHLKVEPAPIYTYYATQVSPNEDSIVGEKIESLATEAKKNNWFFTVITTKIDQLLVDIAKRHAIPVVNVFNGLIIKGTWATDPNIAAFIEDRLGLEMTIYDEVEGTPGSYSANTFREKLSELV